MDDIEHLVRVTLTDRAAAVAPPTDLVRTARGRAHRGRRRAQAAGVAVAAASVVLALPAAARLWTPAPPSAVDAGAPSAVAPAVPPFPFTPGVSLPGYGAPIAELSAGVPGLRFDGGAGRWLTVAVHDERPAPPEWDVPPKLFNVVVGDRKATLELGRGGWTVTWQAAGGRWLRVEADGEATREEVLRFAAGLVPGEVAVRWPFTFESVPPGLVPDVVSRPAVSFRPERAAPSHGFAGKLTVMLSDTAETAAGGGRQVAVGARLGRLAVGSGASILTVDLGDGRTLVVQADAALGLGDATLAAFAAGVRVTPDAVVGQG
ncbi:hypothetical protein GCM10023170_026280 [Phytohabitans houttuyneae]|uniref:hypothetical protein n=1 Tax=Phytohabitans houttuyneae TaxID=1076126 RepID=UPI0031E87541